MGSRQAVDDALQLADVLGLSGVGDRAGAGPCSDISRRCDGLGDRRGHGIDQSATARS